MLGRRLSWTAVRSTDSTVFSVVEDSGNSHITDSAGEHHHFEWQAHDIFVVPNFLWRRHVNKGSKDAVLYTMHDRPLLEKISQYRAQGRAKDGKVVQIVA